MRFNGSDYIRERDDDRLSKQYLDIFNLMKDGKRRTLSTIEKITGHPQASISAQLRHMRKRRFGYHTVNKDYLGKGLYRYRLVVNKTGKPLKKKGVSLKTAKNIIKAIYKEFPEVRSKITKMLSEAEHG